MITIEVIEKTPICELLSLPDSLFKKEALELLKAQLQTYPEDAIDIEKSLYEIECDLWDIAMEEECQISQIIAPGSIVTLHGKIRETKSSKEGTCTFCSERYYPGDGIIVFRPLLYDRTKKEAHVLTSKVILKTTCQHYLPQTVRELEEMMEALDNWYDGIDEYAFPNNHPSNGNLVAYGEVWHNIGSFHFEKLHRRKKHLAKAFKISYNEQKQ